MWLNFLARWGCLLDIQAASDAFSNDALSKASFLFPAQGSQEASQTDWLFHFILWICIFFLVLITGLMLLFVVKYRRRPGVRAEKTAAHSTPLELTWTIIPSVLAIVIFYFGLSGYIDMRTPPRNAQEILVTAQKWSWSFTYPNGQVEPELHVPLGEATRLVMRSEDVIHSFFVPAFRAKMDVVPGRYTKLWFTPTQVGVYPVLCAEYCGLNHSTMLSKVVVHASADYQRWLKDLETKNLNRNPKELGAELYRTRGCMQCHSIDGSRGIAPSFKGIFGHTQLLVGGAQVTVDEDYIRESILEPQAKIVAGYPPVMPTYKGRLKDVELTALIEFIKSLKE